MTRGRKTKLQISLTPKQRAELESWQRSRTIARGLARRGRVLLLLADGYSVSDAARAVGSQRRFVYRWAYRFLQEGLAGLSERRGRGPTPPSAGEGSENGS